MTIKITENMLFAGLLSTADQVTAIVWVTAYKLGIGADRFFELATLVENYIEDCSGPKSYWNGFADYIRGLHLNDTEGVVVGMIAVAFLSELDGSVVYGKQLAERNNVDYEKFIAGVADQMGVTTEELVAGLERKG